VVHQWYSAFKTFKSYLGHKSVDVGDSVAVNELMKIVGVEAVTDWTLIAFFQEKKTLT